MAKTETVKRKGTELARRAQPAQANRGAVVKAGRGMATDEADESRALAEVEPESRQTSMTRFSSTPDFDATDMNLPRLTIAQGLSKAVIADEAKVGQVLLSPGYEPEQSAIVVFMVGGKGRELREDGGQGAVLCKSDDAKTGEGDPGGSCTSCPLASWGAPKKKGGKNSPPECTFFYSYGLWSHTHQATALYDMRKTAINTAKLINTLAAKHGGFGKFVVELSSTTAKNERGTFATPQVKVLTKDTKEYCIQDILDEANECFSM